MEQTLEYLLSHSLVNEMAFNTPDEVINVFRDKKEQIVQIGD
jgi:hypothetical protein